MILTVKSLFWRAALLLLTLAMWVSVIAAQEEVEAATEEATQFGPIWLILLAGLGAIAFLGFAMYSSDSTSNSTSN